MAKRHENMDYINSQPWSNDEWQSWYRLSPWQRWQESMKYGISI